MRKSVHFVPFTLWKLNLYFTTFIIIIRLDAIFVIVGTPTATTLVYGDTTRSLTCTSTGGPATDVTWRKDGAMITINATYQQTQVVTDPVTGTYETVLMIAQSVSDISGRYSCTVGNARGTSASIEVTGEDLQCSTSSSVYW